MASSKGLELLLVSSNLTSTTETLLKEKCIASCKKNMINTSILFLGSQKSEPRVVVTRRPVSGRSKGGERYKIEFE